MFNKTRLLDNESGVGYVELAIALSFFFILALVPFASRLLPRINQTDRETSAMLALNGFNSLPLTYIGQNGLATLLPKSELDDHMSVLSFKLNQSASLPFAERGFCSVFLEVEGGDLRILSAMDSCIYPCPRSGGAPGNFNLSDIPVAVQAKVVELAWARGPDIPYRLVYSFLISNTAISAIYSVSSEGMDVAALRSANASSNCPPGGQCSSPMPDNVEDLRPNECPLN